MTTYTPFRDLLHAANLRHGTDDFTSPQKEGVLRIFLPLKIPLKNPTASGAFEPANLGINPLNPELNPICYLLVLLGAHDFLHVSKIRVKSLTFRRLMSYIYGAPILDVSRSHTTTQHSR